jgi:hypothetical protein
MGSVMLPDGCHLAIGGTAFDTAVIRFWDFASVLKQLRAFEDSLAKPAVRE